MHQGKKLEKLIKAHYENLSINKYGEMVRIKRSTLHDILNKETVHKVTIGHFKKIADSLDTTAEELWNTLEGNDEVINSQEKEVSLQEYIYALDTILNSSHTTMFNGKILTLEEKNRALDMLKLLLSE